MLAAKITSQQGALPPASGLRWLFVDMNSFFASCEQQLNPGLRGRPVVVAPLLVDSTSAIAASYEAKQFGIKTGTPIWEAIETCAPVEAVLSIDESLSTRA